jgi:hypothetical protein
LHPGEGRGPEGWIPAFAGKQQRALRKDAKSRESLCLEPQLQRLENPLSINALNTLRDGVSCSDTMGCGGYVGL